MHTSDTHNADLLSRPASVLLQWAVDSDTTAHHGCRIRAVDAFWYGDDEVTRRAVVRRVSTHTLSLVVRINRSVCVDGLLAVRLHTVAALRAVWLQTAGCLRADTDTLAHLHMLDVGTDADGLADNLVTDAASCE